MPSGPDLIAFSCVAGSRLCLIGANGLNPGKLALSPHSVFSPDGRRVASVDPDYYTYSEGWHVTVGLCSFISQLLVGPSGGYPTLARWKSLAMASVIRACHL
jgi:hypothetical protein